MIEATQSVDRRDVDTCSASQLSRNFSAELHSGGAHFAMELDEMGRFEFDNVEGGPASLVFRSADGEVVKTSWIIL